MLSFIIKSLLLHTNVQHEFYFVAFEVTTALFSVLTYIAEMVNIQQKLLVTEEVMRQAWERLAIATEGMAEVQVLLAEFTREARERDQLVKTLLNNLETELTNAKVVHHARLTKQQMEVVVKEMKILEEVCNLGVRSCQDVDVAELISPVSDKCPLLRNIVETLVISYSTERNVNKTNEQKLLSGHHALALLLNTRNSKCLNDFPLLFGLLCVSYGAGKKFVKLTCFSQLECLFIIIHCKF